MVKEKKMIRKEIYNLQIVRGLAALCVVLEHLSPRAVAHFFSAGQVGVSMFFFLSGYIMMHTFREDQSAGAFIKNRIKRIYPAYLILSLPLICYTLHKTGSLVYLMHNLFLIPWTEWDREAMPYNWSESMANPAAWTLVYEFYFYLLLCVGKLLRNKKAFVFPFTAITMIAILIVTNVTWGNNGYLGWHGVTYKSVAGNLALLSFVAGMCGRQVGFHAIKKNLAVFLLIPTAMLLLWLLARQGVTNLQIRDLLGSCLPSWTFVFLLANMPDLKGLVFDRLHAIGMYSYSLYLFHANFYSAKWIVFNQLARFNMTSDLLKGAILLLFVALSLYFSKHLYRLIERGEAWQKLRNVGLRTG